ncbi:MAG: hypothetical protein K1X89_13415 [Myxococcaceae bacterium]|nr:hypothetical protein [Myxococcaceae bacterium]
MLMACSTPGEPCSGTGGSSGGGPITGQARLALTGVGQTLSFEVPLSECLAPRDVSATATVFDPDNGEVAVTVDHVGASGLLAGADVHFTPVVPGAHHVLVRFEPNLGIAQGDVEVVADRSSAPGVAVQVPVGTICDAVTLLPSRAVLCLHTALAQLDVFRGGAAVDRISGVSTFVTQGDVVWTDGSALSRWEDRGTGPLVASGSAAAVSGAQLKLLPGGDVLEITSSLITRTGFDGGALWEPFPPVVATLEPPVALSPEGGRVLSVGVKGACVASVPGPARPQFGCDHARGTTVASINSDRGGVWAGSLNLDGILYYYPATDALPLDGGPVPSLRFTLPPRWTELDGAASFAESTVPTLGPLGTGIDAQVVASALPRPRGSAVVLESFAPTGGSARGDERQVLVTAPDGTMRLVERGP